MRNAFYTNTLTLLHSPTPLIFPLLYNKNIIVNLYKLYFPSSLFSLQPNKKVFYPPTFPPLQSNTHEGKPNLFYPPTNFSFFHFSTPPTKRTLKLLHKQGSLTFRDKLTWFLHLFFIESFNIWHPLLIIALYHQTKTPISFLCKWKLNPRSFIQPSKILPIEITGTHTWFLHLTDNILDYGCTVHLL